MRELVTFVLGLAGAYLAARWQARKELEADYDRDLRAARINAYRELWQHLEPLAKYAPPGPVTAETAADLAVSLRHWYFRSGGLFLSSRSRDAYFGLQQALAAALEARGEGPAGELADAAALRARGSALRTATAADVGTRQTSAVIGA